MHRIASLLILSVFIAAAVGSDSCASRIDLTVPSSVSDRNSRSTESVTCNIDSPFSTPSIFYVYTFQINSEITLSTCNNADYDTTISVWEFDGCPLTNCLAMNDDFPGCDGGTSQLTFSGAANQVIVITVGGKNGATGSFTLSTHYEIQDLILGTIQLDVPERGRTNNGFLYSTTCGIRLPNYYMYMYSFTAPFSGDLDVSTCFPYTIGDTRLLVLNIDGTCIRHNDDGGNGCGYDSFLTFSAVQGTEYVIAVSTWSQTGSARFELLVTGIPVNSDCAFAIPLEAGVPVIGNTQYADGSVFCYLTRGSYILYYSFTVPVGNEVYIVDTCGEHTIFDTRLILLDSCGSDCITENDDFCGRQSRITIDESFLPGSTVIIAVTGFAVVNYGDFVLQVYTALETGKSCEDAIIIVSDNPISGTTSDAEIQWDSLPTCASVGNNSPVKFYKYTTVFNQGDLTISTCDSASSAETYISIYTTDGNCNSLSCFNENDDSCGTRAEYRLGYDERLPIGTELIIAVHSGVSASVDFVIRVTEEQGFGLSNQDCSNAIQVFNGVPLESNSHDSQTPRDFLSDCGAGTIFSLNSSPVVFYFYVTETHYGEITVDTCANAEFDSVITLFNDCNPFATCLAWDENGCGSVTTGSSVTLPPKERLPQGSTFMIAVSGKGSLEGGPFTLTVRESGYEEPSNSQCGSATRIFPGDALSGTTLGSSFVTTALNTVGASCTDVEFEAPVVFYTYEVTNSLAIITFDTCSSVENESFKTHMLLFLGDCSSLQCVGEAVDSCGAFSSKITIDELPVGTVITVAVFGGDHEAGQFVLRATEEFACSPTGPHYQCQTSYSLIADHECSSGQCATLTNLDLGTCFDTDGCGCSVSRTNPSPNAGDELEAGTSYEVRSIATNDSGFTSDECSFRITVQPKCSLSGPSITCPKDKINLSTHSNCRSGNFHCAVLPPVFLGLCSENPLCSCSVIQTSGPQQGDKLSPGSYTIFSSAATEFGVISSESCKIIVTVQ